jgi:uncharacterized protein (DUF305 family)
LAGNREAHESPSVVSNIEVPRAMRPLVFAALLLLAPATALAQDAGSMPGMDMKSGTMPTAPGNAMSGPDADNMKAMQDMDHGMAAAKPTGDADHDFVTMMLPHHQGAVDMAKVELKYGKDPELRKLADAIIKAQDEEIAMMKTWLQKHGG